MLPRIPSLEAYRQVYRQPEIWLPALRAICQRHHLDASTLRPAPPGSHIVYWVEEDWLVKLFCPLWRADAQTEFLVLQTRQGKPGFHVPYIHATGELEGWQYLVLSRLPGVSLEALWGSLSPTQEMTIARSLGILMADLHRTPTTGLELLHVDWCAFLRAQHDTFAERQSRAGASPGWVAQCVAFLQNLPELYSAPPDPVLLNADLNPEHLFCERIEERWHITGIIDFGDAMLGHPFYEMIAPAFLFRRRPELRRAMLLAYGLSPSALNDSFSRKMVAYTLLHRFASLPEILALCAEPPPTNLDELREILWRI